MKNARVCLDKKQSCPDAAIGGIVRHICNHRVYWVPMWTKLLCNLMVTYTPVIYCCVASKFHDLKQQSLFFLPWLRVWLCSPRQVLAQYLSCNCSHKDAGCQMGLKPTWVIWCLGWIMSPKRYPWYLKMWPFLHIGSLQK